MAILVKRCPGRKTTSRYYNNNTRRRTKSWKTSDRTSSLRAILEYGSSRLRKKVLSARLRRSPPSASM